MRLALVCLWVCSCGGEPSPQLPPEPTPRDAAVIAVVDAAPIRLVGVLTAAESVDIAPRAAGVIVKVHVAAGDAVTEGQVIAEMDPIPLQEDLRAAEAALGAAAAAHRQANVDVEDARRKIATETTAVAQGISPKVALDDAKFALRHAEAAAQKAASTQAAEASRAQTSRDHLADAQLRAPFAGTVAMRYRDAGNRIEAGSAIVRVVGHGGMRLRFAISPQLARLATVGSRVTATIDTIAKPITATIKQVTPSIDAASGMIMVEAQLPDDAAIGELRPGLAAWVHPATAP